MKNLCFLSLRLRLESKEFFIVEVPFQIYKLVFLQIELTAQEDGRSAGDGCRHVEVSYSEAGVFCDGKKERNRLVLVSLSLSLEVILKLFFKNQFPHVAGFSHKALIKLLTGQFKISIRFNSKTCFF